MTTILNGSTIIYNRDGVTIDTLAAQGGNTGGSTANIIRYSSKTVILLTVEDDGNSYACNLPSDAEIGDEVEIYINTNATSPYAYPPFGETMYNGETSSSFHHYIKVSSSVWAGR